MTSFVIFCGLLSGRLTRVGRQDLLGGAVVQELLICASGALVLVSDKPTERLMSPVSGPLEVWGWVLSSGMWLRERAWADCLASLVAKQLGRAGEGSCWAFGAVFGWKDPLKSGVFLSADVAHREQAGSQLVSLESSSLLVGRALSVDLVDLWESSSTFFARQRGRCRPCSGDGSAVLLGLLFQCSAVCNPCGFTFGWMHRAAARAPFGDLCSLSVGQPGSGSISAGGAL